MVTDLSLSLNMKRLLFIKTIDEFGYYLKYKAFKKSKYLLDNISII